MQRLTKILQQSPYQLYKTSNLSSKNILNKHFSSRFSQKIDDALYKLRYPLYYYLIGANVGIFTLHSLGIISHNNFQKNFALSNYSMDTHRYHTILTHGFAHGGIFHLGMNMVGLYFFGQFIERAFGSRAMFSLYFGGVLMGALFIILQNSKRRDIMQLHLGASSAVASILSFFILNFPNQKIIFYFIPVPAWLVGVLLFGQSIMFYDQRSGVSHSGHLGGLIFGVFYHYYLRRIGF